MTPSRLLRSKYVHRALYPHFSLNGDANHVGAMDRSGRRRRHSRLQRRSAAERQPSCRRILTKADLWGADAQYPYQTHAYELAAKIPTVLHQQPCYCYCDRMGHNSLHSCFENTHGARCSTCLKELYYSYQQHQKGKTAAQIRAGIIKGEWKQIDLQSAAAIN